MSYEKKFRQRVLEYLGTGHTQQATAKTFGVGTATVKEWKKRVENGEGLDIRIRQRQAKKIDPERLRVYVLKNPDAYLSEIASEFGCVSSAIHKALKKLKMTRKKNDSLQRKR